MLVGRVLVGLGEPMKNVKDRPLSTWAIGHIQVSVTPPIYHQKVWNLDPCTSPPHSRHGLGPADAGTIPIVASDDWDGSQTAVSADTPRLALYRYAAKEHHAYGTVMLRGRIRQGETSRSEKVEQGAKR